MLDMWPSLFSGQNPLWPSGNICKTNKLPRALKLLWYKPSIQGHPALQALEQMAQRDYQAYTEALEAYNQAVKNASNEEEQDVKAPALPKLEDYVKPHYVTNGETTLPDGSQVTTRLVPIPQPWMKRAVWWWPALWSSGKEKPIQ